MRRARVRWLLLIGLATLAACGPRVDPARARPTSPEAYEALRWVPADASYAVIGARLDDVAGAVRELAAAVLLIELEDVAAIDRGFRDELGFSPWRRDEVRGAGIDPDGGAVVFSRGLFPTLVVRISDEVLVRERLARLVPRRGLTVRLRDGVEVFEWRERDLGVAWAVLDGWLALHLFEPRRGSDPLAWFAPLVDGSPRLGASAADLAAARSFAARLGPAPSPERTLPGWPRAPSRVFPNVLGFANLDRVRAGLGKRLAGEVAPCAGLLRAHARVFVAAHMDDAAGDGVIGVELAPSTAATVRAWLAPPPPPGIAAFLADGALRLELGFDPARLGELARSSRCGLVPDPQRALAARLGGVAITAAHLALHSLDPRGVPSRAALFVRGPPAFVERLLARVPGREALERGERIGTTDVVVLTIPLLPPLTYRFDGASFTGAVGDGVMSSLIAPAEAPRPAGALLAHVEIAPARLPHLEAALNELSRVVGPGAGSAARRLAARLGEYALGRVRLALEGDVLVLRATMRKR